MRVKASGVAEEGQLARSSFNFKDDFLLKFKDTDTCYSVIHQCDLLPTGISILRMMWVVMVLVMVMIKNTNATDIEDNNDDNDNNNNDKDNNIDNVNNDNNNNNVNDNNNNNDNNDDKYDNNNNNGNNLRTPCLLPFIFGCVYRNNNEDKIIYIQNQKVILLSPM